MSFETCKCGVISLLFTIGGPAALAEKEGSILPRYDQDPVLG